ncbi:MAG: FAD-dependent oxidoreductase [Phycisphaeraceae bacterium]|nr:FAD-dependent oxidoreductase [Phycisphaeraceae bacterium]
MALSSRLRAGVPAEDPPPFPLENFLPTGPDQRTITEPARQVPVLAECDLAVLGGGPAGVCAAVAAARAGLRVVLVERYGFLGGMATAANVNIWHSLYGNDHATQVIGGLPEEIIRRLQRIRGIKNDAPDGQTGCWHVDSELTKLVFDDMVLGGGVKLVFHCWMADVVCTGRKVTAAIVENKSGRQAILARLFVDCTGDADLCRRAGAAVQLGNRQGRCQPPTLCFRVQGAKPGAVNLPAIQAELYKLSMDYNGGKYPCFLWGTQAVNDAHEIMLAGTRVLDVNVGQAGDFTKAEIEARYQMRWVLKNIQKMKGWEDVRLIDIATQIGCRESYRIMAEHQVTRDELLHGHVFDDVIAQGNYPIDIHHPHEPGITFEYLDGTRRIVRGDRQTIMERWDGQPTGAPPRSTLCWTMPYRSLVPRDLDNVIAAGRCVGADHEAAGAIRVMINAMQFGEAAGMAAALTPTEGGFRQVDVARLQKQLMSLGVPLRVPCG